METNSIFSIKPEHAGIRKIKKFVFILALFLLPALTVELSGKENDKKQNSLAQSLLQAIGTKGGLCVQLNITDTQFILDLHKSGNFLVHTFTDDQKKMNELQSQLHTKGLYGPVSIQLSDYKSLPHAEDIVNLVVSHDLNNQLKKGLNLKELFRVLVPKGILAFQGTVSLDKLKAAGFEKTKSANSWTIVSKPTNPDTDEWTHFLHGPDGNPVSQDKIVAPPERVKWVDGPNWGKHGSGLGGWVTANGRSFYIYDHKRFSFPGARVLVARDAYNGLILWQRIIESSSVKRDVLKFYNFNRYHLVASKNYIYTVLKNRGPLVSLNAITGKIEHTFKNLKNVKEILYKDGYIIAMSDRNMHKIDAVSKKVIWKTPAGGSIVLAEDRVISENYAGKGRHNLTCIDLKTGKQLWQNIGEPRNNIHPIYYKGVVVLSDYKTIDGYSAEDGKKLWSFKATQAKRGGVFPTVRCAKGLVWSHNYLGESGNSRKPAWQGLDPLTGVVKKEFIDKDPKVVIGERHACCPDHSTENYFIYGKCSFVDTNTGETIRYKGTRTTCNSGFFPANGMTYFSPFACACGNFMRGFRAMSPPAKKPEVDVPDTNRITYGPAKGTKIGNLIAKTDWPTYRGNLQRTAYVKQSISVDLAKQWESPKTLGKNLSAPVIAGDSIYMSDKEAHQIISVSTSDGKVNWRYTPNGRVDSTPSVYGNFVVFGCVDGNVYCLRASDGLLVWRFLAAPQIRQIVSHGQVESVWPVHGTIPVVEGIVYASAGRHTLADDGISVYALDIENGSIKWKKKLANQIKSKRDLNSINHLMSFNGKEIIFGRQAININTQKVEGVNVYKSTKGIVCGGMTGMLDSDWFNYYNTKRKQRWFDGRAYGKILATGPKLTFGMATDSGRGGMAIPGSKNFKLFASKGGKKSLWKFPVPIQVRAIALTDDNLFIAGRKDSDLSEVNKLSRFKRYKALSEIPDEIINPNSGVFAAHATLDGKKLMEIELMSPPVFDGLAIAGEKIYIVCLDGKIRCFGKK
ncbi:MAG: hypothetical protein COA79_14380 [Planctomycetota bacterium]|nr:MAG: hypothetical protein COA79_14380 [Planctomycetota bacterium]